MSKVSRQQPELEHFVIDFNQTIKREFRILQRVAHWPACNYFHSYFSQEGLEICYLVNRLQGLHSLEAYQGDPFSQLHEPFLNFFLLIFDVKMSWAVDLEAQQISRLKEHFIVTNKIRKVGSSACQGNGWLRNKLLNPNGNGNPVLPPPISSKGSALTKQSVGLQVQNTRDTRFGICIPSPESSSPKNLNHKNKAPTILAALGGSTRRPLPGRTDKTA